jgi:hypothetical protein
MQGNLAAVCGVIIESIIVAFIGCEIIDHSP